MDSNVPANSNKRQGSLPPHVTGKVNGYLSMTVNNIKWRGESFGVVRIYVSWWGEEQKALFIPQEEKTFGGETCSSPETTYIYCVMTNVEMFMAYLEDCEGLHFYIYEQGADLPMGTAVLNSLMPILLHNPYTTNCVVIDNSGNEIADFIVSFKFYDTVLSCKKYILNNISQSHLSAVLQNHRKTQLVSSAKETATAKLCSDNVQFNDIQVNKAHVCEKKQRKSNNDTPNESTDIVSNSTISELLEQCQLIHQEYRNCESAGLQLTGRDEGNFFLHHPQTMNYLLGKDLSKEDEQACLETIRTMSPLPEMCQLPGISTRHFEENVKADEIKNVHQRNHRDTFSSVQSISKNVGKPMKDWGNRVISKESRDLLIREESSRYTKFLRLTIQTLSLNCVGMQQVLVSSHALASRTCNTSHLPPGIVYFVEYEIPQCLTVNSAQTRKTRRPWNGNLYRLCSRQKTGKCIHFYRQTIHMLASHKIGFTDLLCNSPITFKIYSRHLNQRLPCLVGETSLQLGSIVKSGTFNVLQELSIRPHAKGNVGHVLSLGTLKLKVEFGTNRTCFGTKPLAPVVQQTFASSSESDCEFRNYESMCSKLHFKSLKFVNNDKNKHMCNKVTRGACNVIKRNNFKEKFRNEKSLQTGKVIKTSSSVQEKILLYGLLHVSQGRDLNSAGTYLISHGFWKEDVMTSEVCWDTKRPHFKFHKIMPVLLSLDLLDRCYNNFMVIETWTQSGLIGIVKLPLNQFYIAYRDPAVVEHLLLSKYPIVGVDGWIDIVDPVSHCNGGQLKVVLALGTENQIHMLEVSRSLKEDILNPQMLPQSISIESDYIVARSAQLNEPLLKSRTTNYSENFINSDFSDDIERSKHNGSDKSEQSLNILQSNDSKISLSKHTNNNSNKELSNTGHHGVTSPTHVCQGLSTDSYRNVQSSSSFINKVETNKSCSVYEKAESSAVNEEQLSELQHETSVVERQKRNKLYPCYAQLETALHKNLKCSESFESISYLENHVCNDQSEAFINASKEIHNGNVENDKQFDIFSFEKGADVQEPDDDTVDNGILNESFGLNPTHNCISNCSSKCDSPLPGNHLSQHNIIPSQEQEKEDELSVLNEMKHFENEILDQSTNDLLSETSSVQNQIYHESKELNDDQSVNSDDNSKTIDATENACTQTDNSCSVKFFAMIQIVNALYISKCDSNQPPSCYVTVHAADNSILYTPVCFENTEPVWNWCSEVWLPSVLLETGTKRLIFKVWHKKSYETDHPNPTEDLVIGFVALDLRALVFGLPSITGWFNINNLNGSCEGHIQIGVTPLEDISKFLNKWVLPKPKTDVERHNKDVPGVFPGNPVVHFINSVTEKCLKNAPEKMKSTRINSTSETLCQKPKEVLYSSVQSGYSAEQSYDDEKHNTHRNICEPSDIRINSAMKADFFELSFYEISNDIRSLRQNIHRAGIEDDTISKLNMTSLLCTDQEEIKQAHTDTLRKKLKELDEIMQQMKDRSEHKSSKFSTMLRNNNANGSQRNISISCSDHVLPYHEDESTSASNEMVPVDDISRSLQDCIFSSQNSNSRSNTVDIKNITNHSQESGVPFSLLHSRCVDSVNDAFQSSSFPVPSICSRTGSIVDGEKCENVEVQRIQNSEVSDHSLSNTDHLMCKALSDMELEDIFNPLLFQHLIAHHQCQKCCCKHRYDTKSSCTTHTKECITPSTSKVSVEEPMKKLHSYENMLDKISDECSSSLHDPDRTEKKSMCCASYFVDKLFHKLNVSAGLRENRNEATEFPPGSRKLEPYVTAKNSLSEYLTFTNCSERDTVYSNVNSDTEQTNKNATVVCNFGHSSNVELESECEQFDSERNTLMSNRKCLYNKISELVEPESAKCYDEKILNIITQQSKKRDDTSRQNSNPHSKSEEIVNIQYCSSAINSDVPAVLHSSKDKLQNSECEHSYLKLDKVDSDSCAEKEKVG